MTIGAATEAEGWENSCNEAVSLADDPERSWVVQSATRLPVHEFPVVGEDGRVFGEPFYAVMGFAPTENGLGIMCRVSQKQVVNVAQHGGMAAVLVAHAPPELRMPKRSLSRSEGAEQTLRAQIAELRHLDHAIALLGWDEETMLPAAGRAERGEQLATLEGIRHTLLISDHLGDLIEEVAPRAKATSAGRASSNCCAACGATPSRCPTIWCAPSPRRGRIRSAPGRRRARRRLSPCSRRPSSSCSDWSASGRRRSRPAAIPTTCCSTNTSTA